MTEKGLFQPLDLLVCVLVLGLSLRIGNCSVVYVCYEESSSSLNIQCQDGFYIKIIEAIHGRNQWDICYYLTDGGDCVQRTNTSLECCGLQECHLETRSQWMTGCGYTNTYLRVVYDCVRDPDVECEVSSDDTPQWGVPNVPQILQPEDKTIPLTQKPQLPIDPDRGTDFRLPELEANSTYVQNNVLPVPPQQKSWMQKEIVIPKDDVIIIITCFACGLLLLLVLAIAAIYIWKRRYEPSDSPSHKADVEKENRSNPEGESLNGDIQKSPTPSSGREIQPSHILPHGQDNGGYVIEQETPFNTRYLNDPAQIYPPVNDIQINNLPTKGISNQNESSVIYLSEDEYSSTCSDSSGQVGPQKKILHSPIALRANSSEVEKLTKTSPVSQDNLLNQVNGRGCKVVKSNTTDIITRTVSPPPPYDSDL